MEIRGFPSAVCGNRATTATDPNWGFRHLH